MEFILGTFYFNVIRGHCLALLHLDDAYGYSLNNPLFSDSI